MFYWICNQNARIMIPFLMACMNYVIYHFHYLNLNLPLTFEHLVLHNGNLFGIYFCFLFFIIKNISGSHLTAAAKFNWKQASLSLSRLFLINILMLKIEWLVPLCILISELWILIPLQANLNFCFLRFADGMWLE